MSVRLIGGDCRDVLRTTPDASVQCVVTSPPYFGLRDYGTGAWVGGDPACDHRNDTAHQKQGATSQRSGRSNVEEQRNENFRGECGKCSARRVDRQIGLESSVEAYVAELVAVFREVRRVLRDDGTLFLNLGDSYNAYNGCRSGSPSLSMAHVDRPQLPGGYGLSDPTLKPKDLIGVPWRVAFALQADGWYLRSDIIWAKPNPMPESVRDRPTRAHEYVFLLTRSARYFYDAQAVRETVVEGTDLGILRGRSFVDGKNVAWHAPSIQERQGAGVDSRMAGDGFRNIRSVWTIATASVREAHFATFPPALAERCVKSGTSEKGCCSAMVKRLRIRPDLSDEQRAMVYARLGAKALV